MSATTLGAIGTLGVDGVRALSGTGLDFVLLDCQHGPYDEHSAAGIVRELAGADLEIHVRVSALDVALIGRTLDAGAEGLVVPMIETAADAALAVAAVHYPPQGVRSFGPSRPDLGSDLATLAGRVGCFVMIETSRGLANLQTIAATPGLAGIMVGPIDLGISLGVAPGDVPASSIVISALQHIADACREAGIVPAAFGLGPNHAAALLGIGYLHLTVGTDAMILNAGASRMQNRLRAGAGHTPADGSFSMYG